MKNQHQNEYGLRCLLRLAREKEGESFSIAEISQMEHVPKHYAQQILLRLGRAGLVKSTRGTEGGFALAKSPKSITVAQVVGILERRAISRYLHQFNKHADCGHQHGDCKHPSRLGDHQQTALGKRWKGITLLHLIEDEKTVGQKLEAELRFNV